jgi:hypothetical protein
MNAKLIYKDVAPGADADAAVSTSSAQSFCNPSLLTFSTEMPKIATLEPGMWILGGGYKILNGQNIPFWSTAMSDEDGNFAVPPSYTVAFDNQYTTLGMYLRFSPATGDYCTSVTIEWYRGATLLSTKSFTPTGVSYFCANTVIAFNKVIIKFNSTSKPFRYARTDQILFGIVREFAADEFSSIRILQEVDLISEAVSINTLEWKLRNKEGIEFIFQLKQPIEAYNNGNLVGVFYITASERTATKAYEISCEDAIGVLDGYPFPAHIYSAYSAVTLIHDIVGADFEVEIDSSFSPVMVAGYIPDCTKREALQQVLFAIGAMGDTSGSKKIRIYPTPSSSASEIPNSRQYTGGGVKTEPIVTAVMVTAHTYTAGSGTSGDDVITVNGTKYVHTIAVTTITNPNVTATDKQNVKKFEGATLVNSSNAVAVAQRAYNYYMRRDTLNTRIVVDDEKPGDCRSISTPWDTALTGNIISMSLVLSRTTAADIKVKAVSA